jgi:ribosomal protein S18 acetylase RimI-like enzyme
MNSLLNNPIWYALTTKDIDKNIGSKQFAYFNAEIAPFIGMPHWNKKAQHELLNNVPSDRSWFLLIAEEVDFVDDIEIIFSLPLFQMTCTKLMKVNSLEDNLKFIELNETHIGQMIELTQATKPGPFTKRTIEFGGYYGIFDGDKLVVMGGERLHINDFTEISAICTHPNYTGLGYASKITSFLSETVFNKGQKPFLHVRADNNRAIDMYKRLGFEIRSNIYFYIIRSKKYKAY